MPFQVGHGDVGEIGDVILEDGGAISTAHAFHFTKVLDPNRQTRQQGIAGRGLCLLFRPFSAQDGRRINRTIHRLYPVIGCGQHFLWRDVSRLQHINSGAGGQVDQVGHDRGFRLKL